MQIDMNLNKFCTNRQWEIYCNYVETDSLQKTADHFGCCKSTIRDAIKAIYKKAAISGYAPESDFNLKIPEGYYIKGASTLYNKQTGEAKLQWIKTNIEQEDKINRLKAAFDSLKEDLPKIEKTKAPEINNDNLLVVYPISDHHIGMLSWADETGQNYDSTTAEILLCKSIDYLVNNSKIASTALIAVLGDFLHFNTTEPITQKNRNLLDSDTRFANIIRIAFRTLKYVIQKTLEKHTKVHIIIEIGNHDISSSLFIAEALQHIYENEPRIIVDTSPSHFHYFKFGKVLIGTHHGDSVKRTMDLPLIMANDRAKDWGDTEYRYWYTGHIHTDIVKDYTGCRVESFRILAPPDAWAHEHGYRSMQDMKSIIIHKDFGEIGRNIINPKMLIMNAKL